MYCQGMCYVMLIILLPPNSRHYQPQYRHFICRLLCVISAQQRVAQCKRFMDSAQNCIFQFLCAEGARPAGFHSRIKHVYGNNGLQHTAVSDWCNRFKEGISSTEDLACPGCPPRVMDQDTSAKGDQMVQCDHCATLWHQCRTCASHH